MEVLNKILSTAIDLFRQYGFKSITMDDIARKAGISKKTLYQHFANKSEVIKESILWLKNSISDACIAQTNQSENAIEAFVKVMVVFGEVNRKMNPIAIFEMERFFPDCFKMFRESILKEDVVRLTENLNRGIEESLYREDINVPFLSLYRIDLSMLPFNPNLLLNHAYQLYEINNEVSEHFLYGIMTAKGVKQYKKYKEKYLKQVPTI